MTKRCAEDTLFGGIPPKRCYGSLCSLDMRLKGSAAPGAVNPPSLLTLLGSRCRKRPHSSDEADERESFIKGKAAHHDLGNHALSGAMVEGCMSYQDLQASPEQRSIKKRFREGDASQKTPPEVATVNEDSSDDIRFYSSQFWRTPLPAVDLSLLADSKPEAGKNPRAKDPAALDAMET